MAGPLDWLRGHVADRLAQNAQALGQAVGLGLATDAPTLGQRAKRWWDLPAKLDLSGAIATDEWLRNGALRNGLPDALRHANWSARSAQATGPVFTEAAGVGHELANLGESALGNIHHLFGGPPVPSFGEAVAESTMDLRNNAAGRRAAAEGRPVRKQDLQLEPDAVREYEFLYDPPPPGREGLPPL
jgi:hypothetical protein